jgi:hypothetical protein
VGVCKSIVAYAQRSVGCVQSHGWMDQTPNKTIRRRLQLLCIYFRQLHSYLGTAVCLFAIDPLEFDESNNPVSKDPTAMDS